MGLTRNREGKDSMSHKSEARGLSYGNASRAGFLEMRKAKSISGPQTLQLMKRPYGVK
uniref:Uncharacterized protein n=1 Tax=Utricularia reniformis TaxID=192314 RepID=A0A1Y0B3I7_9LAMI|nr:hypothetical protein AEK19_MT1721 [Utricularia reniformis]ART31899.1 hypothetical protein AEK19_MT1721 [Utricularia reniformis]